VHSPGYPVVCSHPPSTTTNHPTSASVRLALSLSRDLEPGLALLIAGPHPRCVRPLLCSHGVLPLHDCGGWPGGRHCTGRRPGGGSPSNPTGTKTCVQCMHHIHLGAACSMFNLLLGRGRAGHTYRRTTCLPLPLLGSTSLSLCIASSLPHPSSSSSPSFLPCSGGSGGSVGHPRPCQGGGLGEHRGAQVARTHAHPGHRKHVDLWRGAARGAPSPTPCPNKVRLLGSRRVQRRCAVVHRSGGWWSHRRNR
jgi:hypothetical protein